MELWIKIAYNCVNAIQVLGRVCDCLTIISNTDIPVKYRGKRDSGGIYGSTSSVMGFFLLDGAKAEN